jgi:hypothetical protein
MDTVIGKVTAVDARTKSFTVTAVLRGPSGKDRNRKFDVQWSRDTAFVSKGKTKRQSSAEKIKTGMNVVVQREGPKGRAHVVWHEPSSGTIALTASECKNLGGTLSTDIDCPNVRVHDTINYSRRRCTTKGGSMCVNEESTS